MPVYANDTLKTDENVEERPGLVQRIFSPEGLFLILLAAYLLFTRLWNLGLKPVQHDESMFAYYSWLILDKWELMNVPKNPLEYFSQFREAMSGYNFMAILHGPVLQWVEAITFMSIGDSDYTMRFPQALCSLGIFMFVYRWRGRIGKGPSYFALAFLALSPSFTYLSRFIRPDMIMLFVYFLIIALGWRYREKPTAGRLLALVLCLWFGSTVHETYFIVMFFLATFGFGCWLHSTITGKRWMELAIGAAMVAVMLADALFVVKTGHIIVGLIAPVVILAFFIADGIRSKGEYRDIPFYREFRKAIWPHGWVVVVGSILGFIMSVTLYTSMFSQYHPKDKAGKPMGAIAHLKEARAEYDKGIDLANKSAADPKTIQKSTTTGFLKEYLDKNFKHWDGQLESFRYWKAESDKHRIVGPFHYHWIIMSLYEFPLFAFWVICMAFAAWPRGGLPGQRRNRILFVAFAAFILIWAFLPATWFSWFTKLALFKDADAPKPGAFFWNWKMSEVHGKLDDRLHLNYGFHILAYIVSLTTIFVVGWKWLNRGQYFRSWVDYWTVGSFLAFGYAGEKVPWVTSHIAISMLLACGFYANDIYVHLYGKKAAAPAPEPEPAPEPNKKSIKRKTVQEESAGPGILATIPRYAFPAFIGFALLYAGYMTGIACFRQPGSPLERHSYASSHDDFHAANRWILRQIKEEEADKLKERLAQQSKEGKRHRVVYETPIAMAGTQEWPLFWVYRRFKNRTATTVPATTKAEYVWVANDIWDKLSAEKLQQGGEHWTDRYVWSRIKFRHYWTPIMMDWRALWPGGRWEAPLSEQEKATRKTWKDEQWKKWREDRQKANWLNWNRLFNTFIMRDESLCAKDKGRFEWKWIGGYDVYFGRLRKAPPGGVPVAGPAPAPAAPAAPPAVIKTAASTVAAPAIMTPASAILGTKGATPPMTQQQLQDLIQKSIKVTYISPTPEGTPVEGPAK